MDRYRKALSVGLTIKIKRSSGLVHDAAVSGIDSEKGVVAVEWYENGEMKGKEIDLGQVISLNPSFGAKITTPTVTSKLQPPRRQTNLSPMPSSGIPRPQPTRLRNVENIISGSKTVQQPQQEEKAESKLHIPLSRSKSSGYLSGKGNDGLNVGGAESGVGRSLSAKEPPPPVMEQEVPVPTANKETKEQSKIQGRKSNVVREVSMIKKKRDERRIKNAELKQKKNEDYDPGNPNWQFVAMVRNFRSDLEIRSISSFETVINDRICVCVRKRPLSKKETSKKEIDIITIPDGSLTLVHEPKTKVDLTKYLEHHRFNFDYSFDESATNELVYHYSAKPLVETIFNQGMATCFAYGQTGSGKTHTMGGTFTGREQDATKGIYALAAGDVFRLNRVTHGNKDLCVSSSFFEIYCGKVYDLLNEKKKLRILEDAKSKVQIIGLQEMSVSSVADVLHLIEMGNAVRTSGTTSANQNSSRSHAVFQLILRKKGSNKLHGKLSLIDLAGNERGADTSSSDRQTRWEGAEINKSLLALKECIRALGRKSTHLPFRGSTLTKVLRDSFVGPKARTCMIATISPGFNCSEHTLNTLRYAERVKDLPSKGKGGGAAASASEKPSQPSELTDECYDKDNDEDYEEGEELELEAEPDQLEKSAELQTFHETLSQLRQIEEQVFEEHRDLIQEYRDSVLQEEALLGEVETVDGDPEVYVQAMTNIIEQRIAKLTAFREHLQKYSQHLQDEEAASQRLQHIPSSSQV